MHSRQFEQNALTKFARPQSKQHFIITVDTGNHRGIGQLVKTGM